MAAGVAKALVVVLLALLAMAPAKTNECSNPDAEDTTWERKKQLLALRQTSPSVSHSLDNIRVLLFITTHLPDKHIEFFRQCWPNLLSNSVLLQHADVLLFTANEPPTDILQDVFHGKHVRVENYTNPGYQDGAEIAMKMATTNSWFEGYDWVIRLNPDVLILEDEWLIEKMLDLSVDGIFADCYDHACERHCNRSMVNTDFFVVRPWYLGLESFTGLQGHFENAEQQATAAFKNIIELGKDRWIPGTHMDGKCRVRGNKTVPVLHAHTVLKQCPLARGQPENRDMEDDY